MMKDLKRNNLILSTILVTNLLGANAKNVESYYGKLGWVRGITLVKDSVSLVSKADFKKNKTNENIINASLEILCQNLECKKIITGFASGLV